MILTGNPARAMTVSPSDTPSTSLNQFPLKLGNAGKHRDQQPAMRPSWCSAQGI
jgi:hypothetical protein